MNDVFKQMVEVKLRELSFNLKSDIDKRKAAFEALIDATEKEAIKEKGVMSGGLSDADKLFEIEQAVTIHLNALVISADKGIAEIVQNAKRRGVL